MSLYIHIPFCVRKCAYCDFNSFCADDAQKNRYVSALCNEIKERAVLYKNRSISSIFIGGGTPSCLQAEKVVQILDTVKMCFAVEEQAEISIEMNPGTVDKKKLQAYKDSGINRLSIGLQSTDNDMLKVLGRIHTFEEFENTFSMAREVGFDNINIDLMSALPGQTIDQLYETLNTVIQFHPEHISCYSLIVEEGTPFYEQQDRMVFPDEDEDREMYKMTGELLALHGYEQYEISNYAKVGRECKHNIGYWRRGEYLGLGLGASSHIENCRFQNPTKIDDYYNMVETQSWGLFMEMKEVLTKEDCMEEFMFLGLRMMKGINVEQFKATFDVNIEDVYGEELTKLREDGLLERQESFIRLTKRGIDISNYVFGYFLFD